jgi:hypothetical protein
LLSIAEAAIAIPSPDSFLGVKGKRGPLSGAGAIEVLASSSWTGKLK